MGHNAANVIRGRDFRKPVSFKKAWISFSQAVALAGYQLPAKDAGRMVFMVGNLLVKLKAEAALKLKG
ncbi:MAG: hypothetical protein R2860_04125 [Desulfobacterales bacterium]